MKFSEMPYRRPDVEALKKQFAAIEARLKNAKNADEQLAAFYDSEALCRDFRTLSSLVEIRNTVNTKDAFYAAERDFFDENKPLIEEATQNIDLALLASPYRAELEKALGSLFFRNLEISVRTFKPEIIPLLQKENKLMCDYQKLYASAVVEWEGETLPLPMLGKYKESTDRAVRRRAFEKEGAFFDAHREELDTLYDGLVHVRNEMARDLGYENFIKLGYDRLGRNCYGYDELAAFREQIARDVVPVTERVREAQRRRLGVDCLALYDTLWFADGNPKPHGTADEILVAGREMYHKLSPETATFIDFLYDNELLDVLSRDGKAPGGYCTDLPAYGAPFIFSNFNGTSGDVDVLTHEAGHAFAAYRAFGQKLISSYENPTIEACECHSMGMEFLTAPYHAAFFGADTEKYAYQHAAEALVFLPYGCMVDEFQHIMYENEELTPEERNAVWEGLEYKYRPTLDREGMPFYGRGAGWQRQLHIYLDPLYYIDYCMAQTVAFGFWMRMLENPDAAWQDYLAFVDAAGTKTFAELVAAARLELPYAPRVMGSVAHRVEAELAKMRQ